MVALMSVASGRAGSAVGAGCSWQARALVGVVAMLIAPGVTRGQDNLDSKYEEALKQAISLFGDAKFRECGDALEVLVKQFPKGADAYYYLGLSRLEMKQWRAAREAFTRHSVLSPTSAEARRFIGVTYLQEGAYAEAAASLEKGLAIDPNDEEAKEYLTRAKALLRTKPIVTPVALPPTTPEPVVTAPAEAQPKIAETSPPKPAPEPKADGLARPTKMAAAPQAGPDLSSVSPSVPEPKLTSGDPNKDKPKDAQQPKDVSGFRGVVGMVGDEYWIWMSLGGLFLTTVVWKFVAAICAARFRLPLSDEEILQTCYICLIATALFQFTWWGNNGTWWMTLIVILVYLRMWAWTGVLFAGQRQAAMAQVQQFINEVGHNP